MPLCECECWENMKWRCGESRLSEKRNFLVAALSGALFFTGWWIIFDVMAQRPSSSDFQEIYYICGFTGTLAVIMINMLSRHHLQGDGRIYTGGCLGPCAAMGWIFLGFAIGFASLIAAGWILFLGYVIPNKPHKYFGIAVFAQNLLIFLSGLLYKFGRVEDWEDDMMA